MEETDKGQFCYCKRRFHIKFGKQIFLLVEVKTCNNIFTKIENQPPQKTEYAQQEKQKGNS